MERFLKDFNISEKTGFAPEEAPLGRLESAVFTRWEGLMDKLPQLIKERRLRKELDQLPEVEFSDDTLKSEREWQRAYVLLTFLCQGYIWMEGEEGVVDKIPRKLAVPWCLVAERLGMNPVCTYAAVVLYNFYWSPESRNELEAFSTFTGSKDESWFYTTHVAVEVAAAPGLNAMVRSYHAMAAKDNAALASELNTIASSLKNMKEAMNRMKEGCDPALFYSGMRQFFGGSKGVTALPKGIIYEGVDINPRQYRGASGVQTSSLYSFDIFLDVEHDNIESKKFVAEVKQYMPPKHRGFLEALSQQPSVHDYCSELCDTELIQTYNACIEALEEFRCEHINLVALYIVTQKSKFDPVVNPSLQEKGTGGTEFMLFLKEFKDETRKRNI